MQGLRLRVMSGLHRKVPHPNPTPGERIPRKLLAMAI